VAVGQPGERGLQLGQPGRGTAQRNLPLTVSCGRSRDGPAARILLEAFLADVEAAYSGEHRELNCAVLLDNCGGGVGLAHHAEHLSFVR
jgi:hypothetical protein